MLKRNIMWTFGRLLRGTELHRMPKGIFCMAKNLTEVIGTMEKDQQKEFYHLSSYKGKIFVIVSNFLFNSVVTYFLLAALKSRSIFESFYTSFCKNNQNNSVHCKKWLKSTKFNLTNSANEKI